MGEPQRTLAIHASNELWQLRMKHGEKTRLELGSEGVEGIEKMLHALAEGNVRFATVRATQLLNGVREALRRGRQEDHSTS
ncbi:hypothetical protein C5D98_14940 [Rathayibacter rathayi]|nr:hypothetical protein C5C15_09285 [Rathayibacter rathayi]PPG94313.1 hypothetical protein C5C22_09020 [Rathayibacter rathayi]PPI65245.1 hypothetical protein C5D98_14940 [Rathayibacter rathayi]